MLRRDVEEREVYIKKKNKEQERQRQREVATITRC